MHLNVSHNCSYIELSVFPGVNLQMENLLKSKLYKKMILRKAQEGEINQKLTLLTKSQALEAG